MINQLIDVVKKEEEALDILLELLGKQYKLIVKKDVFKLEAIIEEIKLCNKRIAEIEVERRGLLGENSMKDLVFSSNNMELESRYRSIRRKLEVINNQKETNDILLKQQLSYVNQMLNIINPRRETNTYNSYGQMKR